MMMMRSKKKVNEGVIPTSLGAVVTGIGASMLMNRKTQVIAAGITGFGLAHIVLGGIDIVQHKR